MGFPRELRRAVLQQTPPLTQSLLAFAARNCGDLSSWSWNPGLGFLVWVWDSFLPRYLSQIFIHVSVGPAHSMSMPLLPVWTDMVSSIPYFHSTLVGILMWLCEKVSHVCLCCHLGWKLHYFSNTLLSINDCKILLYFVISILSCGLP